jgi:hypothetical protein
MNNSEDENEKSDKNIPEIDIDDELLESALKVFSELEKNPKAIKNSRFKYLRKKAGHVIMEANNILKSVDSSRRRNEKKQLKEEKKQHDKSVLRSREMIEQKRKAAEQRGLKIIDLQSKTDAVAIPSQTGSFIPTNVPIVALPPPVALPKSNRGVSIKDDNDENDDQSSTSSSFTRSENLTKINNPISCYICKSFFKDIHFFYSQLCPECAALNWEKRMQMADLRGKIVICLF